jgi:hypothetical protein
VAFDWLRADISFRTLEPGRAYAIGAVTVELIEQHHSHVSYAYKFTDAAGKSAVYSTDSEHKIDQMDSESAFIRFFGNCNLVICDTMYSLADSISMKEDWGIRAISSPSTCAMKRGRAGSCCSITSRPTATLISSGCIRKACATRSSPATMNRST